FIENQASRDRGDHNSRSRGRNCRGRSGRDKSSCSGLDHGYH
ncbi:12876_t:CDS:1, partial [Funneliformis mosseae]